MTDIRLQAGFGAGTIRFPETLFPLEGFRGVHDDPKARLMVLKNGADGLALLALELVLCPRDMIEAWRVRIGEMFGLPEEKVWCHVNHTAPRPMSRATEDRSGRRSRPPRRTSARERSTVPL